MTGDPSTDLGVPSVTDDLASSEQRAELRGEVLLWQMLLHQASAELGRLVAGTGLLDLSTCNSSCACSLESAASE